MLSPTTSTISEAVISSSVLRKKTVWPNGRSKDWNRNSLTGYRGKCRDIIILSNHFISRAPRLRRLTGGTYWSYGFPAVNIVHMRSLKMSRQRQRSPDIISGTAQPLLKPKVMFWKSYVIWPTALRLMSAVIPTSSCRIFPRGLSGTIYALLTAVLMKSLKRMAPVRHLWMSLNIWIC